LRAERDSQAEVRAFPFPNQGRANAYPCEAVPQWRLRRCA